MRKFLSLALYQCIILLNNTGALALLDELYFENFPLFRNMQYQLRKLGRDALNFSLSFTVALSIILMC